VLVEVRTLQLPEQTEGGKAFMLSVGPLLITSVTVLVFVHPRLLPTTVNVVVAVRVTTTDEPVRFPGFQV
jgi:hypothetical protein